MQNNYLRWWTTALGSGGSGPKGLNPVFALEGSDTLVQEIRHMHKFQYRAQHAQCQMPSTDTTRNSNEGKLRQGWEQNESCSRKR